MPPRSAARRGLPVAAAMLGLTGRIMGQAPGTHGGGWTLYGFPGDGAAHPLPGRGTLTGHRVGVDLHDHPGHLDGAYHPAAGELVRVRPDGHPPRTTGRADLDAYLARVVA